MSDKRLGSIALFLSTAAMVFTAALHPTAHDLMSGDSHIMFALNLLVHTVAIFAMPVMFLGGLAIWRRLDGRNRLSLSALVFLGFGAIAAMNAAALSGFVAPSILHRMQTADATDAKVWDAISHMGWWMNQAFARIMVLGWSTAILLWSITMTRGRQLSYGTGMYGAILAPIVMLAVGTGHIQLNVHGFGAVMVLEAIWFVAVGIAMYREPESA